MVEFIETQPDEAISSMLIQFPAKQEIAHLHPWHSRKDTGTVCLHTPRNSPRNTVLAVGARENAGQATGMWGRGERC